MKAVIMAGGKGTRLQTVSKDIPKPMFPVFNKPVLEYQIDSLKKSGITDITLIIGHLGTVIQSYFGDGTRFGVQLQYFTEEKPLGTAGALYYLKDKISDDFLLLFGDLLLDMDWTRFMSFHKERRAVVTLCGHPNSHPCDSDVIVTNPEGMVTEILPKNTDRSFFYHNFVNAGVYCVNPRLLSSMESAEKIDLEKQMIAGQIGKGTVYAYRTTEYIKDMGTPDRLHSVTADVKNKIVSSRNLKNRQKAVFLDRDGTINVLRGFLNNTSDFELLPGTAEALRMLNASRYLTIVATNQPVVARGECTFDELEQIHMKMETELGKQGAYIDDLFFCPHHPHKGYEGEIPELKFDCSCRKPKIGMLKEAARKYHIDLADSWYIGDTTTDIQTGIHASMRTILVKTGEAGLDRKYDVRPDYVAENLLEAVSIVLASNPSEYTTAENEKEPNDGLQTKAASLS